MNLCIAPQCSRPDNSDNSMFCQTCGSELLLEGRYRVTKLIGQGGFGKTYEVREVVRITGHQSGIPKVLKVLIDQQPKAIELFTREAQVLSQLRHPGIPQVDADAHFMFWPRDSQTALHCLIMEKVEGLDLCRYMQQRQFRPISEPLALEWLTQILLILQEVHAQHFFHRDIKPPNIMLRPNGQLVLIDFGAVRGITQTYLAKQKVQGVTGIHSMGFTPPEQIHGQAVLQSDFYALGRTFVYLLTGKEPTDSSMYDPYNDQYQWQGLAPQISPPFANLIEEMMARLPKHRPANTEIILQRLRELDQTLEQGQQTKVSPPPIPSAPSPDSPSQPPRNIPPTERHHHQPAPPPAPAQTPNGVSQSSPVVGVPSAHPQGSANSTPSTTGVDPTMTAPSTQALKQAHQHIKSAWIAGAVFTAINLIATITLSGNGDGDGTLIDAVVAAGLTFGIYRKNRVCALLMLAYFIADRAYQITVAIALGKGLDLITLGLGALFLYCFIQGVRGTFTYKKWMKTHKP